MHCLSRLCVRRPPGCWCKPVSEVVQLVHHSALEVCVCNRQNYQLQKQQTRADLIFKSKRECMPLHNSSQIFPICSLQCVTLDVAGLRGLVASTNTPRFHVPPKVAGGPTGSSYCCRYGKLNNNKLNNPKVDVGGRQRSDVGCIFQNVCFLPARHIFKCRKSISKTRLNQISTIANNCNDPLPGSSLVLGLLHEIRYHVRFDPALFLVFR